CLPSCEVSCPQPCTYSRSQRPNVSSCGDSTAVVYPPPVYIAFPGPMIATCPQETVVGSVMPYSVPGTDSSSWSTSRMLGSSGSGGYSRSGGYSGSGAYSGSGGYSG
ncbi:KRSC protein, partial [Eubucco bourcierii]|nr:KRSC protein [Eubucco bourcierii]